MITEADVTATIRRQAKSYPTNLDMTKALGIDSHDMVGLFESLGHNSFALFISGLCVGVELGIEQARTTKSDDEFLASLPEYYGG